MTDQLLPQKSLSRLSRTTHTRIKVASVDTQVEFFVLAVDNPQTLDNSPLKPKPSIPRSPRLNVSNLELQLPVDGSWPWLSHLIEFRVYGLRVGGVGLRDYYRGFSRRGTYRK